MAKGSKPRKTRASAAEKREAREARTNLPTRDEFDSYFDRLHEINDRMDEDRATHMADINAIYEEGAKELDLSKEVFAALFKQDRRERKAQAKAAKADSRTRDGFAKVAAAYGDESPLGQWAARMAKAGASAEERDEEETEEGGEGGEAQTEQTTA